MAQASAKSRSSSGFWPQIHKPSGHIVRTCHCSSVSPRFFPQGELHSEQALWFSGLPISQLDSPPQGENGSSLAGQLGSQDSPSLALRGHMPIPQPITMDRRVGPSGGMSMDHLAALAAGGRLGGDQEEEGDVRGRGPVGGLQR